MKWWIAEHAERIPAEHTEEMIHATLGELSACPELSAVNFSLRPAVPIAIGTFGYAKGENKRSNFM